MRRQHLPTVVAAAVVAVALTAVPAWAAPSFTSGSEAEAGDTNHAVTMQVPDAEGAGDTTEVLLTAPGGFVPAGCVAPVGWGCTVEGQRIRWTRGGALAQLGTFGFQTAVPAAPGTYSFPVRQTGTSDTVNWTAGNGAPAMTVTGESPPPEDDEDTEQQDAPEDPPSEQEQPAADPGSSPAPSSPAPTTPAGQDRQQDGDTAATDATSDSGDGSTAPTRTQGRSNGTTLEITPDTDAGDAAAGAEAPSVAAPDVADGAALDTGAPGSDAGAAAAGLDLAAEGDGSGLPWQQVAGGALLVAGGLLVGLRRWRERRPAA